jgi:hypothetical protein
VDHPAVREPQEDTGGGVSGGVEASRRHGLFDLRWPKRPLRLDADRPVPALPGFEDVPEGLDWDAFSTRCFPGRRRHDLKAISAYNVYTHGRRRSGLAEPQRVVLTGVVLTGARLGRLSGRQRDGSLVGVP